MRRKACPWLTGVLVVALITTAWRLRDANTELDQIERLVAVGQAGRAAPVPIEPEAADRTVPAAPGQSSDVDGEPSDMSSEWEQAVPPMDS